MAEAAGTTADVADREVDVAAPTSSVSTSGTLRRACACGRHGSAGAACSSCRSGDPAPEEAAAAVPRTGVYRSVGRGSARSIFPKLEVSVPGDPYEEEADRAADAVVGMRAPAAGPDGGPGDRPGEEVRRQVGTAAPGADEDDDEVRRQTDTAVPETDEDDDEVRRQTGPDVEEDDDETVQRRATAGDAPVMEDDLEERLDRTRGGGEPLPGPVRSYFEPRFGRDLGRVRVHTDREAGRLARDLNALAFTRGSHVYFAPGRYAPGTAAGSHLLAHELAHTLQPPGDATSVLGRVRRRAAQAPARPTGDRPAGDVPGEDRAGDAGEAVDVGTSVAESAALESAAPEPAAPEPARAAEPTPATGPTPAGAPGAPAPPAGPDAAADAAGSTTTAPAAEPSAAPPVSTDATTGEGGPPADGAALLRSLQEVPPTGFAAATTDAGRTAAMLHRTQRAELVASLPAVEAPTGLPRRPKPEAAEAAGPAAAPTQTTPATAPPGPREQPPPDTTVAVPAAPLPATAVPAHVEEPTDEGGSWWDWLSGAVRRFLGRLPTTDPSVDTSAGGRPRVDTSGDADPTRNAAEQRTSAAQVAAQRAAADRATTADFGENGIHPDLPPATLRPASAAGAPPTEPGAAPPEAPGVPEVVGAGADRAGRGWLRGQVGERVAQEDADRVALERDSQAHRDETDRALADETARVRAEQEQERSDTATSVGREREQWRTENREAEERFGEQARERRGQIDKQIDDTVRTEEDRADRELTVAENAAVEKKRETERKAAEKKREQENRPSGFWDSVRGAVSDFFDELKEAINGLFDALRKFVKETIERAKKAVHDLIEAARSLVVGFIRAFGEFLKGIVTVALAAFPGVAERARRFIDGRVAAAVDTVNRAAAALQGFAQKALDALGAALDAVLALYQRAFTLLLDGLRLVAIGIVYVLEHIGYLVQAARQMPDFLFGEATEELVGQDLTAPLPFERTATPTPAAAAITASVDGGSLAPEDATAMTRTSVPESAVGVDAVAPLELEPELLASLALRDGVPREFGDISDPSRTMAAVQGEQVDGVADDGTAPAADTDPGPEAAPPSSGAVPDAEVDGEAAGGAGPAGRVETHDQETERRLDEEMALDVKPPCPKEKSTEQADQSTYPEDRKFGPLSVGQRGKYLLNQMIKGVKNWFSCNWKWLLAAAIAVLTVLIFLEIITGGAITAAIPPLLEILAIVLIGVAIFRVADRVGDYLSKGWAGEIAPAARSLARGVAIAAIELVFTLLFDFNAILKAAKQGIKATVRAGARSLVTAGKQLFHEGGRITRGVVRSIRRPGRAVALVGRVTLRRGRMIFQGLRRGFAKGARSLDDLARRLWNTVRFRRFKLVRSGRRLQLWGLINPWVLLADGLIVEALEHEVPAGLKTGETFALRVGQGQQTALLITRGDDVLGSITDLAAHASSRRLTPGRAFVSHFQDHRHLLEGVAGRSFRGGAAGHADFLNELTRMVGAGELRPVGLGSIAKQGELLYAFEGSFRRVLRDGQTRTEALMMLMKPDGEFVTLLRAGEGMAARVKSNLRFRF